jgi:alpha-beta hydrolase superfamily lysophospholipase
MFGLSVHAGTPDAVAHLSEGLPVLLLSGERDPVGGTEASQVNALADLLRKRGVPVEQHVYPDARHEVFNETNRDEVTADLLAWLDQRLGRAAS